MLKSFRPLQYKAEKLVGRHVEKERDGEGLDVVEETQARSPFRTQD